MHLINSQQKLEMIDESSGIFSHANDTIHSDSIFGSSYGSIEKAKFKSYALKMPDPRKKKVPISNKKLKSLRKSNSIESISSESDMKARESKSAERSVGRSRVVTPSQSSTSHKVFLRETLKKVGSGNVEAEETPVEPTLRNFKKSDSKKQLSFKEE